jgi:hypothetical protein
MKSVLAIVVGSVFIVVASLIMQLAYVLLAVEYNELAKTYAALNEIRGLFRYLVGMPVFMLIMFFGGIITAGIANSRVLLHCLTVGLVTTGGMMWLALRNTEEVTLTGMVVSLLAITTTMAGGFYSSRNFSED